MRTGKIVAFAVAGVFALVLLIFGAFIIMRGLFPGIPGPGQYYSYGPGMMGGYGYNQGDIQYKTDAQIQADAANTQAYAQVDEQANSIIYSGNEITIFMLGGPEEADEKFVINGLINPTIYVPRDATVTIEFANADEGMPHAFEITDARPPYGYMSMMHNGRIYPGSFIATLPAANGGIYPVGKATFQASEAGTFYYICQYPGHAQEGMYGKMVVQ